MIAIKDVDLRVVNMRTRMPFRYGIATLTATPHVFVRLLVEVDGRPQWGISADHLPPKWFTKDPQSSVRHDTEQMIAQLRSAVHIATSAGPAGTVFELWRRIESGQREFGRRNNMPPLLLNFGVSLVERAVISACCRAWGRAFPRAVRENRLGIDFGQLPYKDLAGKEPGDLLPPQPLRAVAARHTVGLADPLTDGDIPPGEKLDDGLPQSLEQCIRYYGLTHFKIKLLGRIEPDLERLRRLAEVISREVRVGDYRFTLDANENFKSIAPFEQFWRRLTAEPALKPFLAKLIFVEQPLHREVALSDDVRREMLAWADRPPMIIDESDGDLGDVQRALDCGYVGTSHKNCKGIMKSVANACALELRRRKDPAGTYVLSGEDLANVGPVALLEDLAAVGTLGVTHVERNGQHYFRGLSMFPPQVQEQVLRHHGDLYRRHPQGFPALNIQHGQLDIGSTIDAPFGIDFDLDTSAFTPLSEWKYESLE